MNPERFVKTLLESAQETVANVASWQRAEDWQRPAQPPARGERGGGLGPGGEPSERAQDRREDAAASRYSNEIDTITTRVATDLGRLSAIHLICNAPRSAPTVCIVCGDPVTTRKDGTRYYKNRCRRCGKGSQT